MYAGLGRDKYARKLRSTQCRSFAPPEVRSHRFGASLASNALVALYAVFTVSCFAGAPERRGTHVRDTLGERVVCSRLASRARRDRERSRLSASRVDCAYNSEEDGERPPRVSIDARTAWVPLVRQSCVRLAPRQSRKRGRARPRSPPSEDLGTTTQVAPGIVNRWGETRPAHRYRVVFEL